MTTLTRGDAMGGTISSSAMRSQEGSMTAATEVQIISRIARRVLACVAKMIVDANHRADAMAGDPKVGGHPAACASSLHILSALHLGARGPSDVLAIKPHASPVDHVLHYHLGLFHEPKGRRWLLGDESRDVLSRFRKFSEHGEAVLQSYHAESDPDAGVFLPSGSVGIPQVAALFMALANRYARAHGWNAPSDAHFWALMGDSEFREGSVVEALPEAPERGITNLTWIVDYNRQNLDGTRMMHGIGAPGGDALRIEGVATANGWQVVQLRHGPTRRRIFEREGGQHLRDVLEAGISDAHFQALLVKNEAEAMRSALCSADAKVATLIGSLGDEEVRTMFSDLGGHDVDLVLRTLRWAREPQRRPTLIVAHTLKGWGLSMRATSGNHSALPDAHEVEALLAREGLSEKTAYDPFPTASDEARLLLERGSVLKRGMEALWSLQDANRQSFLDDLNRRGGLPDTLGLDMRLLPMVHTQYAIGQFVGKLIRLSVPTEAPPGKTPSADDARWTAVAPYLVTLAPDVGTSTNMNVAMDDKVHGISVEAKWDERLGVRDRRRPDLFPSEANHSRHIRFEITEANAMTAVGVFGHMSAWLGIPIVPVMTVYDFFIKRALDQLYYNLYWGSRFVVVGTPSGATLSPEGAQHSWKSDLQMPNLVTWEPCFPIEVDWILSDTVRRHALHDDEGRTGVVVRGVTREIRQADLLLHLKKHRRFIGCDEHEILEATRRDALLGAYFLVDRRGEDGYCPGENVLHIFAMGSVVTEALLAAERLEHEGIFANIIVVTSADLLAGNIGDKDGFRHLRSNLGVDAHLHVGVTGEAERSIVIADRADLISVAGSRVPIVAVVDGEPGLLDNIGSIVGVPQKTLAMRKASKSGRPIDVYRYLKIDAASIQAACLEVLDQTAHEDIRMRREFTAPGGTSDG